MKERNLSLARWPTRACVVLGMVAATTALRAAAPADASRDVHYYFPLPGNNIFTQDRREPTETGLAADVVTRLNGFLTTNGYVRGGRSYDGRWALWRHGYLVHIEGDFHRKQDVASLRKTWHALTVGAAIHQGRIPSLDEKISKYQGELTGNDAEATWRHVITQSAGFDYPVGEYPDFKPGQMWTYADYNPHHLCHALAKVYGQFDFFDHYDDVLREAYFDAIGMQGWYSRNKVDRGTRMADGSPMWDGPRLILDMEHMGRLGLLVLARGRWADRELIPRWFVEALETKQTYGMLSNPRSPYGDPNAKRDREAERRETPYGFMTWVNTDGDLHPGADRRWARGSGAGGTIVLWNHANGLVFVGSGIQPDSESTNLPLILDNAITGPNPLAAREPVPRVGQWYPFEQEIVWSGGSSRSARQLHVHLTKPDGSQVELWGTHKRDDVWRVKLTPDAVGLWKYTAEFSNAAPGRRGVFLCVESDRSVERVGQWDLFAKSFVKDLGLANPFADIDLNVRYTRPDGATVDFRGFYEGKGAWQFRFMPDQQGMWRYRAKFSNGVEGPAGFFRCIPSTIPGMVAKDESNPMWFGFKGGKHALIRALHVGDRFFASGDNTATGEPWSPGRRTTFLDWAQKQGYNTLSIAGHLLRRAEEGRGKGWQSPNLWNHETHQPNPEAFDRMERILDDVKRRHMLVYPFAGFFGRGSNFPRDPRQQDVHLEYAIARLAPYWNVMFLVGGPEPRLRNRPFLQEADVHRLGRRIAQLDPFDHLLSVHNPTGDDAFKDADWLTYGTLQGPKTIDRVELGDGLLRNHHPAKPLLAQETLWSGNVNHIRRIGGDYSDADLRKNAYVITMCAAALVFADNDGNSSSGFSGSMDLEDRRQERHDVVKRVWDFFETIPLHRLTPRPDLVGTTDGANAFCLAEPGTYYLFYLDAPGRLTATLEGGPYRGEWINAQVTTERHSVKGVSGVASLAPPDGGDDWLFRIDKDAARTEDDRADK